MKAVKPILLLTLLLLVFLALAGCSGGGGGNGTPSASPTASGGYTTQSIEFKDEFYGSESVWYTENNRCYYENNLNADNISDWYYVKELNSGSEDCSYTYFRRKVGEKYVTRKLVNDYIIEVEVENYLVEEEAIGGIFFNYNKNEYSLCQFVISPKTQEYAVHMGHGYWRVTKPIVSFTKFSAIKETGYNLLRVELTGSEAKLYINEEYATTVTDLSRDSNGDEVGLYLSNYLDDHVKMKFDNFYVNGIEIINY